MLEKSITFYWSTISHHLGVLDQHRRRNTAVNVNLDRSEHLSVLFININETRKELCYVLGHPHFRQMNKACYYVCNQVM